MGAGRYVYLENVECLRLTDKAAQIKYDGETYWIPFSQMEDEGNKLKAGQGGYTLGLTRWICEQKDIDADDD